MINSTRKLLNFVKLKRYHISHKRIAEKALKNITKGSFSISLKRKSDEYAKEILGDKVYAPWLYVYSALNNEFKEGWIPDNYYGAVVVPKLKGAYGKISHYRALNSVLLTKELLPDAYYFTNGLWLDRNLNAVSLDEIIKEEGNYIFKKDETAQGKGIIIIDDKSKLNKIKTNGVLQRYIQQHEFFNEIMPSSVATIRLTSYINKNGDVTLLSGYLRASRKQEKFVKSSTGLRISFDVNTGKLQGKFYDSNWSSYPYHPDSGFNPEKREIPNYSKIKELICNEHKRIPFARIIGWDLILDSNDNVQIMEWNGGHNDIKFSEAMHGPIFLNFGFEKLWQQNDE